MAKVTSKLQVTIPKRLAEEYGIEPGDEIEFRGAGDTIRVIPPTALRALTASDVAQRLRVFDAATARQAKRQRGTRAGGRRRRGRGWTREELYERGGAR